MYDNEHNNNYGNDLSTQLLDEYTAGLESSCDYENFYLESFFICSCMNCIPIINEITVNNIKITFICKVGIEQYTIEELYNNFIKQINTSKIDFNHCKNDYKEIDYYCVECKEHLCKQCCYDSGEHDVHTIKILDNEIYDAEEKLSNINSKINKRKDINPILKKIFSIIYNNYLNNKRYYSYIKIFDAFNDFLNHH